MTMLARFFLLLTLAVLSWAAVPIGLALTWISGRFFASILGWA